MADRTVNVTINYKVNTAEVQKAQAASQAAQKATDQLRKSAQQYGTDSSKAFKQSADGAKLNQKEVSSLGQEFSNLYSAVRLLLTAGLAKELVTWSLSMAKLSGTVEGVERAFRRLPNATLLLKNLQDATHGTVTDLELMQKALMAQNFRIPLDKLGKLLEFAAVKAQQTGQEVNHLVNYIVSGIGYRSIKRLDDLGFTANRVKEALGGVSLQAASMGQVMDAVTKLMQEDLDKTGGFAETSATRVENLERKFQQLRVTLSGKLENSWFLDIYDAILTGATDLIKAFPTDQLKKVFTDWDWTNLTPVGGITKLGQITDIFAKWQIGMSDVAKERAILNNANAEAARIEKRLSDLSAKERLPLIDAEIKKKQEAAEAYFYEIQAADMTVDKFSEENIARKDNLKEIEATIKVLQEYRQATEAATDDDEQQLGIIERKREEIEQLQDAIEKTTRMGDLGAAGVLTKALKKAQEELEILLGKEKKEGEEVRDYLAYLSEQEMEQVRGHLAAKVEQRKKATEEELRLEKEAKEERERLAKEEQKYHEDLQRTTLALGEELLRAQLENILASREIDLDSVRDSYDKQIELAGDNERAKKELRIKEEREIEKLQAQQKEREKKAAVTRILIDGLVAIGKIFRDFGWPGGIVPAAIMANITAVNAATVRKYKKGGINIPGPGTETSDSIPAMLSKGESVITAQATRKSMGLLEAIQANKIDDRIMKQIDFSGGRAMSDSRIVNELQSLKNELMRLKSPDVIEQAGILYRVYTDEQGNKKRIRSKSANG